MNRKKMETLLEELDHKIAAIADPEIQEIQKTLLNLIEFLLSENDQLRKENQQLKDEINRLKGEQGKPTIRKQTNKNISSESDRKPRGQQPKKKKSKKKKHKIKINREKICVVDKNELPSDAIFKGYRPVVVQDIRIEADNIKFKKEIYYSPSKNKTLMADLPLGYQGEFGPRVKALIIELHHNSKMTESAILRFLRNQGVVISAATVCRILTDHLDEFHQEKEAIVQAGLASGTYQQMDDTSARVRGKNAYTHIMCNPFFTAYFTRQRKDRMTLIDILTQSQMRFVFNESSYAMMKEMNLSETQMSRLRSHDHQEEMDREQVDVLLEDLFPDPNTHTSNRRIMLEASAMMGYQQLPDAIKVLLVDDAPQFKLITESLALCWVHDARHYKKLTPIMALHKELLKNFLSQYWAYYHKLLAYKNAPTPVKARGLEKEFDELFSTRTYYDQLDERIMKTKYKQDALLLVLEHPELPLHNNASELGARTQARYRDISFHTMSEKGTQAKDTFMTLVETAKKLSVNTYHYFFDRLSEKNEMPSLASLIEKYADASPGICDTG